MIWPGGDCPNCGETMPPGSVHCRYCQASLVSDTTSPSPLDDSEHVATTRAVRTQSAPNREPIAPVATPQSPATIDPDPPSVRLIDDAPHRSLWREALLNSGKWIIAALLLAPLFVSSPPGGHMAFSRPIVHSGDEPHYLVLINSVISDGDFDLANNYADVHAGGPQAGRKFAGWALDHQVNWYAHGRLIHWWEAYETDWEKWDEDPEGNPTPTRRDGSFHPVSEREYSQHPPGLAVLLAPVLLPFRGSGLVEPAALLCSALATVAGMLAFCRLVEPYARTRRAEPETRFLEKTGFLMHGGGLTWVLLAAAMAYLGSPLWHYGRTLFVEPYLAFLAVAAYAAVLRSGRYLAGGLLLAAGVLIKPPFLVLALPLIGEAALRQRWDDVRRCGLPIAAACAVLMFWNHRMYGGWLRFPQQWEWGRPLEGLAGLAFSARHGLLLFAPALLLSLAAMPEWFRRHRRDAMLVTIGAGLYLAMIASWAQWWGGTCYSARLIVPIVPLLFAPLAVFFNSRGWRQDWRVRCGAAALMVLSIFFSAVAAFAGEHVWDRHPVQLLWGA